MDSMVSVDPQLFVTCRLCVDNIGKYQITPTEGGLKDRIKYCFDIDIEPFDGLPQLICEDCEVILSDYYTKKRTFIGKQNALKMRLQLRKEIETTHPSPRPEESGAKQEELFERPRRISSVAKPARNLTCDDSCDSSSDERNLISKAQNAKTKQTHTQNVRWDANYNKLFVCRLCNKHCRNRGNLRNHSKKHRNVFDEHQNIFTKHCTVTLEKCDSFPNLTGENNTVIFNQDKIIRDEGKNNYYVLYTLKNQFKEVKQDKENIDQERRNSTSDDDFAPKRRRIKRQRLDSRSSTDTIVLNNTKTSPFSDNERVQKTKQPQKIANTTEPIITECINIDSDSSSSESQPKKRAQQIESKNLRSTEDRRATPTMVDYRSTHEIVSACVKKYSKKLEQSSEMEKLNASNKNKILNIGLKAIHQQGFKCTGLLRYLELDHLDIIWTPIVTDVKSSTAHKESKHARIMPRLRIKDDDNNDELVGFKRVSNLPVKMRSVIKPQTKKPTTTSTVIKSHKRQVIVQRLQPVCDNFQPNVGKFLPVVDKLPPVVDKIQPIIDQTIPDVEKIQSVVDPIQPVVDKVQPVVDKVQPVVDKMQPVVENVQPVLEIIQAPVDVFASDSAILYMNPSNDADKKLLNANPVANPKQLPKKAVSHETKVPESFMMPTTMVQNSHLTPIYVLPNNVPPPPENPEMCMPIITSTTSLADNITYKYDNGTAKEQNNVTCNGNDNGIVNNAEDKSGEKQTSSSSSGDKPASGSGPSETPRIKVKPASELMSERALSQQGQPHSPFWIVPLQKSPVSTMQGVPPMLTPTPPMQAVSPIQSNTNHVRSLAPTTPTSQIIPQNGGHDFLILDTVEMPNTKTSSPLKYIQSLLRLHNIILLNGTEQIRKPFSNLVKFKLQFSQQSIQQPVVLQLSLNCNVSKENEFYLGVRDPNHPNNIDLNKLSANWQWEILKIYRFGDLAEKLKNTAASYGSRISRNTEIFISVMQSIKMKTETP